jgi:hypothetical protein
MRIKDTGGIPAGTHVFEMPLNTNPTGVVVTAEIAKRMGFEHVLTGRGLPVLITRDGACEVDPDQF